MTLAGLFDAPLVAAAVGLAVGIGLGLLHFTSLRRVTDLYVRGGPLLPAIALQVGRLVVIGVGLAGLALFGPVPLLAGALGILLARQRVLRRVERGA